MASSTHITIGGQLRFGVSETDSVASGGEAVRALHIFDVDEQVHYEIHLPVSAAETLGSELAGHGIVIATRVPENGAQAH